MLAVMRLTTLTLLFATSACCSTPALAPAEPVEPPSKHETRVIEQIGATLDAWHAAAARADEDAYFSHFTDDAVFLGTDATERWDRDAFRAYAHPHFAKGKAWSFEATRRDVTLSLDGRIAWFDEALATPNLGPARGSGVLLLGDDGRWRIAQYNLAITVPNERFDRVKQLLEGGGATVRGIVSFTGKPPKMIVPKAREAAELCKDRPLVHDAVRVHEGALADVWVRLEGGTLKPTFEPPAQPVRMQGVDCTLRPRMLGAQVGQSLSIENLDTTLKNVHLSKGDETLISVAQPGGSVPIVVGLDEPGLHRIHSDLHPWINGFVAVTQHPFFDVSASDGSFTIEGVPPGRYTLATWHAIYGSKALTIEVTSGDTVVAHFSYHGAESPPAENRDELKRAEQLPARGPDIVDPWRK